MRWKTRRSRLTNSQYEVLQTLSVHRPGVFKPLEARLARVAALMVQGIHPWLKTSPNRAEPGTLIYTITSDGRAKYNVEKQHRGD